MKTSISRNLAAAALVLAISLLTGLAACNHDAGAASDTVSQLRIIAYNGKASTAVLSRLTEAVNRGTPTGPMTDAVTNVAGTALGVTMSYNPLNGSVATIQTTQGFYYSVDAETGDVQPLGFLYFTSNDCSGQAYLTIGSNGGNSITAGAARQGVVFVQADGNAYMVAPNSKATDQSAQSESVNGACSPIGLAGTFFVPAVANDPATSGVAGPNVGGNITLGAPQ